LNGSTILRELKRYANLAANEYAAVIDLGTLPLV